jgi:hypothetical protein
MSRGFQLKNLQTQRVRYVACWPISTDAALQADVGFRGTAEVREHHRDNVGAVAKAMQVSSPPYSEDLSGPQSPRLVPRQRGLIPTSNAGSRGATSSGDDDANDGDDATKPE